MKPVIIYTLLAYMCAVKAQTEADCRTPTDLDGQCIPLDNCEELKPLTQTNREYLTKWHCGFDGALPKVCCPIKVPENTCITFSGLMGLCVPLRKCPYIQNKLTKPVSAQNLEYVQRSRCNRVDETICCEQQEIIDVKFQGGEATSVCGLESSSDDKIIGGTQTAIDAYTWLVILEYSDRNYQCGGSLISSRYVLTAAHCLVSPNNISLSLGAVSVRVGDYDKTNEGKDCIEVAGGGIDCTEGDISVQIESTIVHPEFNANKSLRFINDIALIRLMAPVPFTEFIRPVCLPAADIIESSPSNLTFFIAGWGAQTVEGPQSGGSNVKLEAQVPYVDKTSCDRQYSNSGSTILGASQFCAGGEAGKDTCKGDSGGPISYLQKQRHEIVGIISFGITGCGTENKASVYTKVYDYLPWIQSNIKP